MEETINKLFGLGVPIALNIVAAVIIYVIGKWAAGLVAKLTGQLMTRARVDEALMGFTKDLVYFAILVFTAIAAIGRLGVETTSIIAVLGAAGLAVGLALQGTLSNFASGVIIILFRPFKVGDTIQSAGIEGTVKEIQIFNTILAHADNRKIIIPNSQITGAIITNFTAIDKRRIDMVFGVSYGDDLTVAKEVIRKLADGDKRILKDSECVIAVSELSESSVNIVCRPWVKPDDYWAVYFDLTEKAKIELENAGCSIPFPQRDIHIFNESAVNTTKGTGSRL